MAASFHFYTRMFSELNDALGTYVSSTASNIIGAITPVATTLATLYVMLWGWAMMRGVIQEPITDGVSRVVRLALILGVALQLGYYNGFVADWLWSSPDALASYIAGGGSSTANAAYLDSLMERVYDFGDVFNQSAHAHTILGFPDISKLLMAYAIWAAGLFATGYGAFTLALSKMALAILLGVGPIFILLTIFEPTKKFFDAWLGQALNYVFLVMLSAAAIRLILTILESYLLSTATIVADPGLDQALPAIAFSIIGALTLIQMPSVAAALGGGVAVSTLGAVGWAYARAKGTSGAAAKGTWNLASGKTLSNLQAGRRERASNAQWARNHPGISARAARRAGQAARTSAGAPLAVYRKITQRKSGVPLASVVS